MTSENKAKLKVNMKCNNGASKGTTSPDSHTKNVFHLYVVRTIPTNTDRYRKKHYLNKGNNKITELRTI